MIERLIHPANDTLLAFLVRPPYDDTSVRQAVTRILKTVRDGGDTALLAYEREFDHANLTSLIVSEEEMGASEAAISPLVHEALVHAAQNIMTFHAAQRPVDEKVETEAGVLCWRKSVPIDTVGLYVPGARAPLCSTVLMLAIPARLAGCRRIILTTPPRDDGTVHPAILHAARIGGVSLVVKAGGAQAIAALAYGTESVPKADKIFGPGNRFVTCAKQLVAAEQCAIDMPAGPSEVMVVIDHQSNRRFAAADMLSQMEHGADSQAILVVLASDEKEGKGIVDDVESELNRELEQLSRKEIASRSLEHAKAVILASEECVIDAINAYAPEHLIINTSNATALAERVVHAGSVFLGPWSPESAGDYASGVNHTLPTGGWARSYSGVSLDSFFKKITFQRLTREGLGSLGPTIETMAHAESLDAHAQAVSVRLAFQSREDE